MPRKNASPELIEAIDELTNSTAKTAQDKILAALVTLAWPDEKTAPAPAPEPPAQ